MPREERVNGGDFHYAGSLWKRGSGTRPPWPRHLSSSLQPADAEMKRLRQAAEGGMRRGGESRGRSGVLARG